MGMGKETRNESEPPVFLAFLHGLRNCYSQGDGKTSAPKPKIWAEE
jgi:hypothetical protein